MSIMKVALNVVPAGWVVHTLILNGGSPEAVMVSAINSDEKCEKLKIKEEQLSSFFRYSEFRNHQFF